MIISFKWGVLLFPPEQEEDFASVSQTEDASLFCCCGSLENSRDEADVNTYYLILNLNLKFIMNNLQNDDLK